MMLIHGHHFNMHKQLRIGIDTKRNPCGLKFIVTLLHHYLGSWAGWNVLCCCERQQNVAWWTVILLTGNT